MTFVDILVLRHIRFHRTSKATEVAVNCPFCTERGRDEDKYYKLGINMVTGEGHCFRCGWATKKYALRAFLSKLGEHAAMEDLEGVEAATPEKKVKPKLPKDYEPLTLEDAHDDLTGGAWKYLKDRGISDMQILRNGIGVSMSGKYAYRIIFPVRLEGKLKGFVARDYTGRSSIRYLNSLGEKSLYNLMKPTPRKTVILSEGVFKALRIERATGTRSSAVLGNTITEEQVQQLLAFGYERVVFWPDHDSAGIKGLLESSNRLIDCGLRVSVIYPIPDTPADDLPIPDIRQTYLDHVVPFDWALRMRVQNDRAFPG